MHTMVKATETIPYPFRFLLTWLECFCALGGIIQATTTPGTYLASCTRGTIDTIQPDTHFVYWQLGGGWAIIFFIELVILRLVDDLRVWKLLCTALLFSDALYTHSLAMAAGGWVEWMQLGKWHAFDWITAVLTWPFVLTRLAIVLGIGMKVPKGGKRL